LFDVGHHALIVPWSSHCVIVRIGYPHNLS
jgi:hypothetical protein